VAHITYDRQRSFSVDLFRYTRIISDDMLTTGRGAVRMRQTLGNDAVPNPKIEDASRQTTVPVPA
jgi:hypothetical protein